MRLSVITVGKPGAHVADAIREYEERARRYWSVDVIEVKAERASRGKAEADVRAAESERLLKRVPAGFERIVLTRTGDAWSSARLARYLNELARMSRPGAAFLIGGAFGLDDDVLREADKRMRLSAFTLPHDFARLVLAEQLYRAGTLVRGEPYHKGGE